MVRHCAAGAHRAGLLAEPFLFYQRLQEHPRPRAGYAGGAQFRGGAGLRHNRHFYTGCPEGAVPALCRRYFDLCRSLPAAGSTV